LFKADRAAKKREFAADRRSRAEFTVVATIRGYLFRPSLSGDEFAGLLTNLAKPEDAGLVAQKILAAIGAPIDVQGHRIHISASIGIALFPADGGEADDLLTKADVAMYRGKEEGRNIYKFYLPEMNERTARRLQMEGDLRQAMQRGEFVLHYQPKADLTTGSIVGFEALLRWQHLQRGLVSPAEFVPILEDTGLIDAVGAWVVQSACAQLKAWQAQGIKPRPIAVNISARQLQPEKLQRLIESIKQSGIKPELLKFELTESLLMKDLAEAIRALNELRSIGVRLSVDDFGTGYSSLAYLKRFPIDEMKIDRAFVRDVTNNSDDAEIALAIINLAHSLKLTVVAEGVETEAQLAFLRMHGCDEIQGFYFSKPLEAEAATQALLEDRHLTLPSIGSALQSPTILVVDDNKSDLELVERALEPAGYRILVADSARAAFNTLLKEPVNVVISDHNMVGMSGVEFLTRLRKLYPSTIRIVMTGLSDVSTMTDAINEAGIEKFLSKNWDSARLLAEVHDAYLARNTDVSST
jgi:EAL domain-containing protein (putative c-di-GMP-specific phosphodiesterase class I)/CheY-like chemotaxis protein